MKEASKHDLSMLADNKPHQGFILDASPSDMLDPVSCKEEQGPLWVALDEVTDPHNFRAVIQSAYLFGAAGVVVCANNSAPLSGVVCKASAGALECMELRSCRNMMQFLSMSAEDGWRVLGGSFSSRALPLNEVPSASGPAILVLGSERKGFEASGRAVMYAVGNGEDEYQDESKICSGVEFQPFLAVESLNVSVAAGILLHHVSGNPKQRSVLESAYMTRPCSAKDKFTHFFS
ncbi:rRNA methyltransferase 1 [Nymphaea thermarum]|nr:rRNA methyltransferase 1 [Nymphaea thermarum]